jgi:molybdopterin molybdotransferase
MPSPQSLSVAAARQAILDALTPITGCEAEPIRNALGRVLCHDVVAPLDVPTHDNSAMDGYALRSADLNAAGELVEVQPFEGLI